ncbi:sensor histidine kinase [Tenggerimyces flavus]|uniref:histidine kinase n=1 Tax=Tenggerimyces flavus TaxID=1708749 RepID=A0ABV7YD83_9ACTN|nr:histidine kinase [Tenggerimyces flavus]MBM7788048.1 signal transduction histidine kinase [Tenggerimyces flavus]
MDLQSAPPVGGRVLEWTNRWFDRAAPVIAAGAVVLASVGLLENMSDQGIELHAVVSGLIGIVCGVPVLFARRRLWPLFVVAALGWIVFLLWPAMAIASYYVGSTFRRRLELGLYVAATGVASAIAAVVSFAIGGYREYMAYLPNAVIALLVYVGLPLVVGLWVNARRQLLLSLRERAERAEREQAARSDRARTEERGRIAREMHDVVAHRVSLIVLHAGALEVSAKDPQTAETADLIRTTGREALADLRTVLGVLRSQDPIADKTLAPQPVLDDLDRLLEQSRAVGIDVRRTEVGDVRALPVTVERTAYRVIQEALTNVHKHAGAVRASVLLTYRPEQLEVVVENEASTGGATPMPASGFGLVGLAERVHLVGGTLSSEPRADGGFVVRATLPAAVAADQPVGDPA